MENMLKEYKEMVSINEHNLNKENLELKVTVIKIKTFLDGLNIKLDMAEEKISDPENR